MSGVVPDKMDHGALLKAVSAAGRKKKKKEDWKRGS